VAPKPSSGAEAELQHAMLKLRYSNVPVISAVRGLALGGGCELAIYSSKRVAAMESYIGLVEVGVGLVPGAGGLTYIARRAAENMALSTSKDVLPFLTEGFTAAAMAKVGTSALESRKLGYLLDSDVVVAAQGRAACLSPSTKPRLCHLRLPCTAQAQLPRGRSQWHCHHPCPAGQHARRRLHQRARLPYRLADCRGGVRRPGGCRHPGDGGIPHGAWSARPSAACSTHPKTQERIMGMMSTGKPVRN